MEFADIPAASNYGGGGGGGGGAGVGGGGGWRACPCVDAGSWSHESQ